MPRKEIYQKYKDRYKEKDREYRQKNKDKINARRNQWNKENKEKVNEQALSRYHANREHKNNLAKKYRQNLIETNPSLHHWRKIKYRAKANGIDFNIDPDDIAIPEYCPVLGIPLIRNDGGISPLDNSPTVDRIDSKKGYIKGNVVVISARANRIKNDASWQELQKIADWLKEVSED